jgi:hypothetical protein
VKQGARAKPRNAEITGVIWKLEMLYVGDQRAEAANRKCEDDSLPPRGRNGKRPLIGF